MGWSSQTSKEFVIRMTKPGRSAQILVCVVVLCAGLCGCGGGGSDDLSMGQVTGTVRLDGQPLPGVAVLFAPETTGDKANSGGPSTGVTDKDGKYKLEYSDTKSGAVVGKHTVRLTTGRRAGEDETGKRTPPVPEKLPAKYNLQSTLTQEVKPGENTFDFDLKSK